MIKIISRLAGLLANLTLALLVVTAAAVGAIWWFGSDLPDTEGLAKYEPATMSRVYSTDGEIVAEYARERRLFTPIEEIPALVKNAIISAEDKNFYTHPGVDAFAVAKAIGQFALAKIQGRDVRLRGASGITQQVMKNFLLTGERAFERKIKEAVLAYRIEKYLSKDRILELYLNEIFLGRRAYGVAAAALTYFGKNLDELTIEEAAFIATLPPAPSTRHLPENRESATFRRNVVIREMAENGYITEEQAEAAKAVPIALLDTNGFAAPDFDYFGEEIRRELIDEMTEDGVYGGGMTIRATIDPKLQRYAREALQEGLEKFDRARGYRGPVAKIEGLDAATWREQLAGVEVPHAFAGWRAGVVLEVAEGVATVGVGALDGDETVRLTYASEKGWVGGKYGSADELWSPGDVIYVKPVFEKDSATPARWTMRQIPEIQGAFMAMDPITGRVLAMQGGFAYETSVYNRATQASRQPGSSFKPFVYAAALQEGYTPNTIVLDAPVVVDQGNGELWKPKNYSDKFYGPSPMRIGIEKSRNLMTVRIAQDVGMDLVAWYAERFGVYDHMPHLLSYSLGAGDTTLYRMVTAYAMFANGGRRIQPTLVDRIQDRRGETVFRHDRRICDGCLSFDFADHPEMPVVERTGEQVMGGVIAYQLVSMMEGVTSRGTAARLSALGFPVAGKTGTTNDGKDAWFIGFTPNLVAGCWMGFDTPTSLGKGGTGGGLCAPVFQDFMERAMKDREKRAFQPPKDAVAVRISLSTGRRVSDDAAGDNYVIEYFPKDKVPTINAPVRSIVGGFPGDDAFSLNDFNRRQDPAPEPEPQPEQPQAATPRGGGGAAQPARKDPPPPPRPTIGAGSGGLY